MADAQQLFRSVILCDDIRDEVGNKKSLMGVIGGDIVVAELPAAIQVALYLELAIIDKIKETKVALKLFVDKEEIAKVQVSAPASEQTATIILPRGIVRFDKEGSFRVTAAVNEGAEIELVNKKLIKQVSASA